MSFIEKIQKKSKKQKLQIMAVVLVVVVTLLVILWIFTSRIGKTGPADLNLFKKINQGFKDIRENYKK